MLVVRIALHLSASIYCILFASINLWNQSIMLVFICNIITHAGYMAAGLG